jgi:hypothetical protein
MKILFMETFTMNKLNTLVKTIIVYTYLKINRSYLRICKWSDFYHILNHILLIIKEVVNNKKHQIKYLINNILIITLFDAIIIF